MDIREIKNMQNEVLVYTLISLSSEEGVKSFRCETDIKLHENIDLVKHEIIKRMGCGIYQSHNKETFFGNNIRDTIKTIKGK